MRKYIIKIGTFMFALFSFLMLSVTTDAKGSDAFVSNANALGFSISDDFTPIYMDDFEHYVYTYKERGVINYQTTIDQVLLRNDNDHSLWCFVYRVITSPCQVRNHGFLGINSYGDDWNTKKVRTTINFRSDAYQIVNYAPKNNPSTSTGSIGIGYGKDGFSVSASVDFAHSELDIVSNTSTANHKYETIYNFNGSNSFTRGDYYSYGMVMFRKSGAAWVDVTYEIGYNGWWYYGYNTSAAPCTNIYTFTF